MLGLSYLAVRSYLEVFLHINLPLFLLMPQRCLVMLPSSHRVLTLDLASPWYLGVVPHWAWRDVSQLPGSHSSLPFSHQQLLDQNDPNSVMIRFTRLQQPLESQIVQTSLVVQMCFNRYYLVSSCLRYLRLSSFWYHL